MGAREPANDRPGFGLVAVSTNCDHTTIKRFSEYMKYFKKIPTEIYDSNNFQQFTIPENRSDVRMQGVVVRPLSWPVHASVLPRLLLQNMDQPIYLHRTEIHAPVRLFKAAVRLAPARV
jgi:hypothetical protein